MEIDPNVELQRLEQQQRELQKNITTQPKVKRTSKKKATKSEETVDVKNNAVFDEPANIVNEVQPIVNNQKVNNEEEEEDNDLALFIKNTMSRNDEIVELKNTIKSLHENINNLTLQNAPKTKQKKTVTSDKHKEALARGREKLAKLREEKKQALLESKKEITKKYSGKHNLINKSNNNKKETEIKKEEKPAVFKKQNKEFLVVFD